ncbi:MAG: hypothetical protein KatS3mg113_0735 [Planctomycetaceae bacterium]|nr:MAG: hypothetical protein KatS3mg113_0735 [Planctomycetaceae bacterium]
MAWRPDLIEAFKQIVGPDHLLVHREELLVYECDGYTVEKSLPDLVVFPTTTSQVADIVRLCHREQIPYVPRGAGTSLAGGCLPVGGGRDDLSDPHATYCGGESS